MDEAPTEAAGARYLERRIDQSGLRPRIAAGVIATAWLIAIAVFGIIEHLVDPETFNNVWLGMWWATQTVTTVGYGDTLPDQTAGQIIAVILMVGGLSLFAVVTGTITSAFVTRAQTRAKEGTEGSLELKLDQLTTELEAVRVQLAGLAGDDAKPPG